MYRKLAVTIALLLPLTAFAAEKCEHSKPVALDLDLAGVNKVMFEVNAYDLKLSAAPGNSGSLGGRMCASTPDLLSQLHVTQQKTGDTLHVHLRRDNAAININLGSFYTRIEVAGTVPDNLLVQLKVGSGDASLTGARAMSADVGSGDVIARDIKGQATVSVGSGDIQLTNVGSLHALSVGSGDLTATGVRGPLKVGSVGSGDLKASDIGGAVEVGSIGSGDVALERVRGDVSVDSIGSGDLKLRTASGNLSVSRLGSGSVDHRGVGGTVTLPRKR
jgi:DUF4097 and DUF4098 domain-containing protein YvlB